MEVLRTRLCEWQASAIDTLALAPTDVEGIQVPEPRLAVGRANGVVELWDTSKFHLRLSTPGNSKRSIRGLVWLPGSPESSDGQMRLFSAGLHREITEWDVRTLQPIASVASGGGPVWSLTKGDGKVFAACEDGSVRMFSVGQEPGDITMLGKLAAGTSRILSLTTFGTDHIFVGGSDSRIGKWSLSTRTCEANMRVERLGKENATLVWALATLGDHAIASGDSLGLVCIWDPIACVMRHRFEQHQADVLVLATDQDGNTLLSSGVDAKISIFGRQETGEERWVYRNADFGHTHDVRAIVLDNSSNGGGPVVSGGVSGVLRACPLNLGVAKQDTGVYRARQGLRKPIECSSLSPLLQTACVAQSSRILLCQKESHLEFWYMQQAKVGEKALGAQTPEGQHVLRVSLEGGREGLHLAASAIAPDGQHLVASDEAGTRLFKTNLEDLEVRKETGLPSEISKVPSRALAFCGPSLLAVAPRASNELLVLDVKQLSIAARFSEHRAPVARLAASGGGEWLASADLDGYVHLFSLDALAHHAQVPIGRGDGFPTAMEFDSGRHRLLIVTSSHNVLVFDVEARALAPDVPHPLRIPNSVLAPHVRVCGVVAPPAAEGKLLLWGHNFMMKLDLQEDAGAETEQKKRRVTGRQDESRWHAYENMEHIVSLSTLEEAQWGTPVLGNAGPADGKRKRPKAKPMVLTLEVAPSTLKKALPESFERKKYSKLRSTST